MEGGDFERGGGGWGPRTEHVEGEFSSRKEEVPEVRGKSDVSRCETRDEMVFGGTYGSLGLESTMLAGSGKGDSDVREAEQVNEGLGGFVVNVEMEDGVAVGFEEGKDAFVCRAV